MLRDIRRTVRPRSVNLIKQDGRTVEEETVSGVMGFFYAEDAPVILLSAVLVSIDSFARDASLRKLRAPPWWPPFPTSAPAWAQVGPMEASPCISPTFPRPC